MIMPSDYVENCTFDTHINPKSYNSTRLNAHLSLTEKIVGIYNGAISSLNGDGLISHTFDFVDFYV